MAIDLTCPCGQRFRVKDELAGKRVTCTKCRQPINVPVAAGDGAETIVVTCACGAKFSARESSRGRRVVCPQCSQPLTIGETQPPLTPAPSLWDSLPAASTTMSPAAIMMRHTLTSAAQSMPMAAPEAPMTAGTNRPAWEFGVGMVLCFGVLIVGLCLLGVSVVRMGAAAESSGWQQTTATITHSEAVEKPRARRQRQGYTAVVRYSYSVDGLSYSGDRVTMGDAGSVIDGRWTASKYKVGTNHTAWFNPRRPSEAVLEKGVSLTNIFWLLASLVVVIASTGGAGWCGLLMWRRMSPKDP